MFQSFLLLNTIKMFIWKSVRFSFALDHTDFYYMDNINWNIFQNVFFYVLQKIKSYRFALTWEWINNDRFNFFMFIFQRIYKWILFCLICQNIILTCVRPFCWFRFLTPRLICNKWVHCLHQEDEIPNVPLGPLDLTALLRNKELYKHLVGGWAFSELGFLHWWSASLSAL